MADGLKFPLSVYIQSQDMDEVNGKQVLLLIKHIKVNKVVNIIRI